MSKIKTLITGVAVLGVSLGASSVLIATAQATPGVCKVSTTAYPTIQSAVDDTTCTTIKVAPGTYPESVVINRSLTLDGAQANKDARTRSTGSESIIQPSDITNAADLTINADYVTIDGFTLDGPTSSGSAAVVTQNSHNYDTIKNNIISNPGRAASIQTSYTTFERNVVSNSSTSTDGFQANSVPVSYDTISNNTFAGTVNPAIYNADTTFIEGQSYITVTGNVSTDDGTLAALFKTDRATIAGNTISGHHGSSAIYIGGADSNIVVRNNTVISAGSGVNVANDFGIGTNSGVKIVSNTLQNNTNGIKVGALAVAADRAVLASHNQITGSTDHGFNNFSSFNQEATCNWWGATDGPSGVGSGSGDAVTTEVAFAPWVSAAADTKKNCNHTASGDLRMAGPSQRIKFSVTNRKNISNHQGNVENFNNDYPGGLHYSAKVTCSYVDVQTGEARFMFQIPAGHPGLSGLYVVAYVKAVPEGTDLYGHAATGDEATAMQWCENGVGFVPGMYTVTSGNVKIKE